MISPLRILYLEDDPKDAELVRATLEAADVVCEVTRVETQSEFSGLLQRGGFDLILADYTLPLFDGISALKIAKEIRPEVPFIFVSGTLGEEVAIEALKMGATDYVFKTRLIRILPSVQRALRETEERTERKRAEEALRQAQADLARINRVTTMGELTASLAHEVNQPIAAAITDANTCLRWLTRDQPDLDEARAAASRMVKDGSRAAEIISRMRLLFQKGTPELVLVDVNEVIREMIVLLYSEITQHSISVCTELAKDLPRVRGDHVRLQQVMMNLIMNSIDAMKDVDGTRELTINSQRAEDKQVEDKQVMVLVSDTGVGLPRQEADQIFNAFFTTKPHGTGMGLRISRSIVESYGGRLWAADNSPRGASFYLALPTKNEAHE